MAANVQSGSTSTLNHDIQQAKVHGASHHETIIDNVLQPTPSHFEKLYLEPQHPVVAQPNAKWTFGNPTPIAIAGFVLANTHATIDLMGWGGAGGGTGNASAGTGSFYFCGAVLLYFGGLVGDLSKFIKGKSEKLKSEREMV
ncbi:Protein alcS [Pseudocercospora fuligena]|uniref:Protein alcS n=1 Tax=Pseudocercospora fuligena TaxID=685502 RepID=A0A8H6RJC1_9PEZI|nr:Protein alcS [Pseudocercospora fuligena]